jgi:hypothetical protein
MNGFITFAASSLSPVIRHLGRETDETFIDHRFLTLFSALSKALRPILTLQPQNRLLASNRGSSNANCQASRGQPRQVFFSTRVGL